MIKPLAGYIHKKAGLEGKKVHATGTWHQITELDISIIMIEPPGDGHWVALIK